MDIIKVGAPGRTATFSKRKHIMLLETSHLENKRAFVKRALSDLLPTDIIHTIDMWLVGLKNCAKLNAVVAQINSPRNTVLRINYNRACKITLLFGNLSFYSPTQYKWSDICTKGGWRSNVQLINYKHG